ncbi:endonuclease domain-containing 1 protein-like [Mobula hypostoma]|uniref:endonuclease domain-containing 1 protein-like n=1 Tax=Mobula hypostoma TaxID=723540 RepID=UPI002FC28016
MLPLALLTVLSSWSLAVHGDVVSRFHDLPSCLEFFYRASPPLGFVAVSQVHICQRLSGTVYYATLFDPAGRLPIYSAFIYKYRKSDVARGKGVHRVWKYEPQLAEPQADGNMTEIGPAALSDNAVRRSQAVGGKFPARPPKGDGPPHVRVMLNPANLQGSWASRSAAYTVTNAVAVPRPFYHKQWKPGLKDVLSRIRQECRQSAAYLVSGAVRGRRSRETWVPPVGKGRAASPHLLWLTYCCSNGVSGALLAQTPNAGQPAASHRSLSLGELEEELASRLGRRRIRIYQGGCSPL